MCRTMFIVCRGIEGFLECTSPKLTFIIISDTSFVIFYNCDRDLRSVMYVDCFVDYWISVVGRKHGNRCKL